MSQYATLGGKLLFMRNYETDRGFVDLFNFILTNDISGHPVAVEDVIFRHKST